MSSITADLVDRQLWDIILGLGSKVTLAIKVGGGRKLPVVRFKGHYYLMLGHPFEPEGRPLRVGKHLIRGCRLLAKPGNPWGDLEIRDGLVQTVKSPGQILGIDTDLMPVPSPTSGE